MNLFTVLTGGVSVLKEWFRARQERQLIQIRTETEIAQAEATAAIARAGSQQDHEHSWEQRAQDNSGWKDEYWTVLLSLPLILVFIPGMTQYVLDGFRALEETPEWYRIAVGLAIGAAFGVRKFSQLVARRRSQ